ncbi:MAG TPA: hypothetical protein VGG08_01145 [Solirubrobacteraceae bacterium]|jgi:hypothetical protein
MQIDYLVLSDVTLVLHGLDTQVITDTAVQDTSSRAREYFTQALRRTGSYSAARSAVNDLLIDHRLNNMNRPGGYWVASLDEDAPQHALTGSVPRSGYDRVLLCSDGFARLVDLFGVFASWGDLIESRTPLAECARLLREAEARDPESLRHPRWTVSDDASAILLGVPGAVAGG